MEKKHRDKTALVLGATGGIGGEMARQLVAAGWQVRALRRSPHPLDEQGHATSAITWVPGDAMNRADVMTAAEGCSVIVHAVNPPGYRRWGELVLPMVGNTIAAAKAQRATIVLPGTVYNYGPDAFDGAARIAEDAPQQPQTAKGAIRVQLEQRLRDASSADVQVIIVRAGDFFGPLAGNSWFAQGLVKPGMPVKEIRLPGKTGVGHQWAYLPDVARTMVSLLNRRDRLPVFSRFHMNGHWDHDGRQFAGAISRVVVESGGKAPAIKPFAWWLVALASPFLETLRELREMRYLWNAPVRMDNTCLVAQLGAEPNTPLDVAIRETLVGLKCVEA